MHILHGGLPRAAPIKTRLILESIACSNGKVIRKGVVRSMKLVWLEAFVAVAEKESFTDAATAVGKSQGSVSRYVKFLEEWLGQTLVESYPPVQLTTGGKAFLLVARQVLSLLSAARNDAQQPSRPIDPSTIRLS